MHSLCCSQLNIINPITIFVALQSSPVRLLLALVLHCDHHHVGLVDQVGGGGEHDDRLAFLEILLQCVGKLLAVLHKLPLSLVQRMFALNMIELQNCLLLSPATSNLGSRNVCRNFVDGIKQFLDCTCYFFDCFQECFAVSDLVRDSGQDSLQIGTFPVELLEWLLSPAAPVLQTVLVTHAPLQPQDGLVHVDAEVCLVNQSHHEVVGEPRVGMFNLDNRTVTAV